MSTRNHLVLLTLLLLAAGCAGATDTLGEDSAASRYRPAERHQGGDRLALGIDHGCALVDAGTTWCWGDGALYALGDGATSVKAATRASRVTTPYVAVGAGDTHSCGLTASGTVQCWGGNAFGQLGFGSSAATSADPVNVSPLVHAVELAVGKNHACALTAEGGVKCWGHGDQHQLGDLQGDSSAPKDLSLTDQQGRPILHDVIDLAASHDRTCAVEADGTVACWGAVGPALGVRSAVMPAYTGQLEGVQAVAVAPGSVHTCALLTDGTVACVGANNVGQLGDGTTNLSAYPVTVATTSGPLANVTSLAAGKQHTCAVVKGGRVFCWGDNAGKELGATTSGAFSSRPVQVQGLSDAVAVVAGEDASCALRANGRAQCWGRNTNDQLGRNGVDSAVPYDVTMSTDTGIVDLAVGALHVCQRRADGTLQCWGEDGYGQLGNGSTAFSPAPADVLDVANAIDLSTGGNFSCAVRSDHTVACWGTDDLGALGDGYHSGTRTRPWPVAGLSDALQISSGYLHSCVVTTAGAVKCWGSDNWGNLGDGVGYRPDQVVTASLPAPARQVAAGESHTCALLADGISCWGANSRGQLGNNNSTDQFAPVAVQALRGDELAVAAGGSHSCALSAAGLIECWGDNQYGQLGDGSHTSAPHAVTGSISGAVALALGGQHTCALLGDGTVSCFGRNTEGQLGVSGQPSGPVTLPVGAPVVAVRASLNRTCVLTDAGAVTCYGAPL
jgi:alpha-tubulin suppressor-like RCC1 family protein